MRIPNSRARFGGGQQAAAQSGGGGYKDYSPRTREIWGGGSLD